jgi:peptidoglycan hydrolase-like protein with peptidoglycan-binding domain
MAVPYHVAIDVRNVREGFSSMIQDVQEELIRLGYEIGDPDGLNGPRTARAIANVQAQLKMAQDGQASQELLNRLREAKPALPNKSIERTRGE